jgi:hypothetical protein
MILFLFGEFHYLDIDSSDICIFSICQITQINNFSFIIGCRSSLFIYSGIKIFIIMELGILGFGSLIIGSFEKSHFFTDGFIADFFFQSSQLKTLKKLRIINFKMSLGFDFVENNISTGGEKMFIIEF